MADHPAGKQSTTGDRTSALVASGLVVLAVLGVVTVFSDAIAAAWSPNAPASAPPSPATIVSAPASPAPSPPTGAGGSS
jgi:hypothetical protein